MQKSVNRKEKRPFQVVIPPKPAKRTDFLWMGGLTLLLALSDRAQTALLFVCPCFLSDIRAFRRLAILRVNGLRSLSPILGLDFLHLLVPSRSETVPIATL